MTRDSRAPCQDISSKGTRVAAPGETLFFLCHRWPQKSAGAAASKCRSSLGKRAQAPNEAERGGIATAARALRKGVPRAAVPRRICVSFMRERAPTTLSASAAGIVSDIRSQTLPLFTLTRLSLANRANCYGYETTDAKTRRMLRLLPISLSSHERAPYACMNTMNTEAEELLRNLQGCGQWRA